MNFPCNSCKHLGSEHYSENYGWGKVPSFCEKCFYEYSDSTQWQHIFKANNLKYLEQIYEQKVKVNG